MRLQELEEKQEVELIVHQCANYSTILFFCYVEFEHFCLLFVLLFPSFQTKPVQIIAVP